jgi:predicted phosphate transport protein (TIGR00153 family)
MRFRLIPTDDAFFALFNDSAANVADCARRLRDLLADPTNAALHNKVKACEHRGDEIVHTIVQRLNTTFVTPFDREDIHALISGLDDVLDFIEESADTFILYRIEAPTAVAVQQASIIVKQCELLVEALENLRGFKGLEKYWIEVHRLENEGDQLARKAIAGLFSDGGHPIEIIKWKDIYAHLEAAIDKCEDVANIIERITIKHA